jgi:hypothetical protein
VTPLLRAARRGRRWLGLLAAATAAGCGPPEPEPHVRVAGWWPRGSGVPTDAAAVLEFSGAVAAAGLADGTRLALARASDVRAVSSAVESDAGLGAGAPVVGCDLALSGDGRRVTLRPRAPLAAGVSHALVLGPVRDAAGRPVLDPDGRRRTFVATFETVPPPPGPPPRPVITEARADAATPEAGGEYVEAYNLGEGPLDLAGWRLLKRTSIGALASCVLDPVEGGPVAPGAPVLLTGLAWDGRYGVPPGVARYACPGATLAGGLPNDRPPAVSLADRSGAVVATLGEGGAAPACPAAVERIDPEGPDAAENLACAEGEGTPGACNSVTPGWMCP